MASADRILQILGLFTPGRPAWTPQEAAQALKLSRASAYRYFAQLEEAGFIEPAPGRRFALGPRIVELDRQIRLADPLVQASVDEMQKLARETGGIALLCRLHKDRVLCIHQERGSRAPRFVSYERGRAMPLHRGATSKVILAFLPQKEREQLAARVEPKGLDEIRRERLCIAYGEVDPDACGIAVPLEERSRVLGSLSVVLPASVAKGRLLTSTTRLLRAAGRRIERELDAT
ncbi:MAG TPA: IclR family transcriptional regulator [Burkholderiales bacterium]|nr:IclR family transcriptional regulator [Burkholderiales bacterium]